MVRAPVGKATKPSAKPKGMKTTLVTTPNTALSAVAPGCNAVEALETTPHTGSPQRGGTGAGDKCTNGAVRTRAATRRS